MTSLGSWRRARVLLGLVLAWMSVATGQEQRKSYQDYYDEVHALLSRRKPARGLLIADHMLRQLERSRYWWPWYKLLAVEACVMMDDLARAHAELDDLDRELIARDLDPLIGSEAVGLRGELYLIEGRLDLASECIEAYQRRAEGLLEVGRPGSIRGAHELAARLELACARNESAAALVDRYLADVRLYPAHDAARARLLLLRALAEEQLTFTDDCPRQRSRDSFRATIACADDVIVAHAWLGLTRLALDDQELRAAEETVTEARALVRQMEVEARTVPLGLAEDLAAVSTRLALVGSKQGLDLGDCRRALEVVVDRRLKQWADAPPRAAGRGFLQYRERRETIAQLIHVMIAQEDGDQGLDSALELLFRVQRESSLSRARRGEASDSPALTVDDVRAELLGPRHGMLVYLLVGRQSHVIALDRESVSHELLPGLDSISWQRGEYMRHYQRAVDELDGPLRSAAVSRERSLAEALATSLLPPAIAERVAGWGAVTIVGLDTVGMVPFEWLPLAGDGYLGVELAVDYLPTVPFAFAEPREPAEGEFLRDLLLVAGPRSGPVSSARWPELAPLVLNRDQRRRLTEAYSDPRAVMVLEGRAANAGRLASELAMGEFAVLQLLVHAVQDVSRARPTALALSPDARGAELLTCDDIDRLERVPRCVVLSACRSGVGPERRGDPGSADMSGAWLAAGTDSVLVSYSDLRYDATVQLMADFHGALRRDACGPAEAMRWARERAVAELGSEAPLRAGLVHTLGLGHRPVFPRDDSRRSSPSGLLVAALLLAVVAAAQLARRALRS